MLAKKTSRNRITLPQAVVDRFPGVDYFKVSEEDGRIVLQPVRPSRGEEVRTKLAQLGIGPDDVRRAVTWTRKP